MTEIIYHIHFGPVEGPIHTGSGNIIFEEARIVMSANRLALLDKVYNFWIESVLKASLHGATFINLDKEAVLDAIDHSWRDVVRKTGATTEMLSTSPSIWELFNQLGQNLLILGEPGAGKTTMLLNLAREAYQAAITDISQPVPIYFNLSSWKGESLIDWLATQLSQHYDMPENIGRSWLEQKGSEDKENNQFMLLLDGLDELDSQLQKACITAINQFKEKGFGRYLAVACREQAYNDLHPLRLRLDGSIRLKPLTLTHIDAFLTDESLTAVAPKLEKLQEDLQEHELLWELARNPLMLNIMVTVYQGGGIANLDQFDSLDALGRFLFKEYTCRMFKREVRKDPQHFSEVETRKTLSWLAQNLLIHHQSIFLLENMQPGWLTTQRQQKQYTLFSRIVTAVLLGLLFDGPVAGWVTGLLGGSIVGLLVNRRFMRQTTDKYEQTTTPRQFFLATALVGGLLTGPLGGLVTGIAIHFILMPFGTDSWRYGMVTGILLGIALTLIRGFVYGLVFGSSGRGQDIHEDIQRKEDLVWSWNKALTGFRSGLGTRLIVSLLVGIGFSTAVFFLSNLVGAIIFGVVTFFTTELLYGLLLGVIGGLRGEKTEVEKAAFPGAGLQKVFKNMVFAGTAVGLVGGFCLGVAMALIIILIIGQVMNQWLAAIVLAALGGVLMAATLGITLGGVVALWFGGVDLIQHHSLRFLLRFHKTIPAYRITSVLDYAAERILLRKVGGGYIFIHRLLQEHFAAYEQTSDKPAESDSNK